MKALASLLILLFLASAALAQDKPFTIGEIEFFGYLHLNLDRIKSAFPLHEGDVIAIEDFPATKEKIGQSVKRGIGRDVTDVNFVCCDDHGNLMIFVGLPGESTGSFQYNPKPKGSARLPRSILELYDRAQDLNLEAVQRQPGEDRSKGYGLSAYAPMRETQLKIRQFAIHSDLLIRRVLQSSAEPNQRQAAAYTLGYVRRSRAQISALVRASRDADDTVRNNSVPALGVLASSSERVSAWIPAEAFAPMLNSGVWEDRNKAGLLLDVLSRRRDPRMLSVLRSQALESLVEMARWRDRGHASYARVILGRIAGIEEMRLQDLAESGKIDEIINAVRTKSDQ